MSKMTCFKSGNLFYLVSDRAETPIQGPFHCGKDLMPQVASALRFDEIADEIARLENEPQPAAERDVLEGI